MSECSPAGASFHVSTPMMLVYFRYLKASEFLEYLLSLLNLDQRMSNEKLSQ